MKNIKGILVTVATAIFVIFVYAVVHEGGHALAVLLQGGQVTQFDVNFITSSPHISWVGDFSAQQRANVSLAGPLFPYLLWLIMVPLLPKIKANLLKLVLVLFSFSILGTLLPQAILPIASEYGANVAGEDIVRFIYYSGFNPFAVSAITVGQLLFSAWYLIRVGRLKEFIPWVTSQIPQQSTATRWQKVLVIGLLLVGIIGLRSVSGLRTREQMEPIEYDAKIEIDFADHNNGTIYEFSLSDYQVYHFVYSLDTKDPVTLKLTTMNPSGFLYTPGKSITMYQGAEKLQNGQFTGFILEPGDYQIELDALSQFGELTIYISSTAPTPEEYQFLELIKSLREGSFTAEHYREPGYELIYHGQLEDVNNQLLYTLNQPGTFLQISAFVVGTYEELDLRYREENREFHLLDTRKFFRNNLQNFPKGVCPSP